MCQAPFDDDSMQTQGAMPRSGHNMDQPGSGDGSNTQCSRTLSSSTSAGRQQTITEFFSEIPSRVQAQQIKRTFRDDRKRRIGRLRRYEKTREGRPHTSGHPLNNNDRTLGCVTQNVNGFGDNASARDAGFRGFRGQGDHGRNDIYLLQETHVERSEVGNYTQRYAAGWGFRTGAGCPTRSFWSPSVGRKAGVAILVDPYGAFTDVTPIFEQQWTPHFMAVQGTLYGESIIVVNVYAPHRVPQREAFFRQLADIGFPHGVLIAVGGDFNCTLDDIADRSYRRRRHTHDSPALRALIAAWGLADPVVCARPRQWRRGELRSHYADTHTYHYTVPGHGEASSRLDRWYVNASLHRWVANWEVIDPAIHCDHHGAKIHIVQPDDPIRVHKAAKVYPPPSHAVETVRTATKELLADFYARITKEGVTAVESAQWWDDLKRKIVVDTLSEIRTSRRRRRNTLAQKLRRLCRQQKRVRALDEDRPASVDFITGAMETLTLDDVTGGTPAARLRRAIADCKRERSSLHQKRQFAAATYWEGKTTREFFRRISSKYADNTIRRLDPVPGCPTRGIHEKADTLADAWSPIFQQAVSAPGRQEEVARWIDETPAPTPQQDELATEITEAEVAAALTACKVGKACGPDSLGNGWYHEYAAQVAPILTILLNLWYNEGVFPASFLEADIFCLKKSGDLRKALNYRPIALLNTYYKIFTRILATRMRETLDERIHPNQHGFVPGRTIHEVLHIFEAAQKSVNEEPLPTGAIVMLLDFMKAYGSLSRGFLLKALRRHGFPEKFITAVALLHTGTTVRFLANGFKSRKVPVSSGIRQGCPLAPLLFILALDALYREIDRHPNLHGVTLRSAGGEVEVRVAGFADDTAVYLTSPDQVQTLLDVTSDFGAASGLQLNHAKTMVIALHADGSAQSIVLPDSVCLQDPGEMGRYLGIYVGSRSDADYTWEVADRQLRARLHMASQKTTTVEQRSVIASAIIVPKLTYIGQHAWPSTSVMNNFNRKIKNYVWHGCFATEVLGARGWLDADLAALPRTAGGLAVPDLTRRTHGNGGSHGVQLGGHEFLSRPNCRRHSPIDCIRSTPARSVHHSQCRLYSSQWFPLTYHNMGHWAHASHLGRPRHR